MPTVIKIYFYRFFVWLIAFLQMCIPSLGERLYSVDPTSGDVNVIAEPGYAARVYPLGDGRLIITFQTDEDKDTKGDNVSIAKVITAKITNLKAISPALFSKPEAIFPEEHNDFSLWGGIHTDGQKAYYAAGTPKGAVMNVFDI